MSIRIWLQPWHSLFYLTTARTNMYAISIMNILPNTNANTVRYMSRMPTKNDKKNMKQKSSVKAAKLSKQRQSNDTQLDGNMNELMEQLGYHDIEGKMATYISNLQNALSNIQLGRASITALDHILVNTYNGKKQRISELGQISIRNNNTLVIQLYDIELNKSVEQSIKQYNPDLNPQYDSTTKSIHILFPKLTRDTRDMLIKQVHKHIDQTKIHIRTVRQDSLNRCKTILKSAGKDDLDSIKQQIQLLTDESLVEIDIIRKDKENELNE